MPAAPASSPALAPPFALMKLVGSVLLLSFVGGYLDAAFFLALFGLFIGLQTGNIIVIASFVERGGPVVAHAMVIAPWLGGIFTGAVSCAALAHAHVGRRASLVLMLPVCAALIGAALGVFFFARFLVAHSALSMQRSRCVSGSCSLRLRRNT